MPAPIRVDLDGFERKRLEVVPTGLVGPKLLLDGQKQVAKKKEYRIVDDTGAERIIQLRPSFPLDPVPVLRVDGRDVHVARPLTALEKVWLFVPFALVAIGGALGGLFGTLAAFTNSRVLRSPGTAVGRHVLCLAVTVGAAVLFVMSATVVQLVFHSTEDATQKAEVGQDVR